MGSRYELALLIGALLVISSPVCEAGGRWTLSWRRILQSNGPPASTLADTFVFAAESGGGLVCLDARTGGLVWRFDVGIPARTRPVSAADLVAAGLDNGTVFALDRQTGQPRWTARTGGEILGRLAVSGGTLFVPDTEGRLTALDLMTGRTLWRVKAKGRIVSAAQAGGERVFFGSEDGVFRAVDRRDGMPIWDISFKGAVVSDPCIVDSLIFVASGDGYMHGIDAATGLERWRHRTGGLMVSAPLFSPATASLVTAWSNGLVYAFDALAGSLRWRTRPGSSIADMIVQDGDANLLVASHDGLVMHLSAVDGNVIDSLNVASSGAISLAAGHVDVPVLVVGDAAGAISCFAGQRLSTKLPGKPTIWDHWTEELYRGVKVGYTHVEVADTVIQHARALRASQEEVSWQGGFRRTATEAVVDSNYRPISFEQRRTDGDQTSVVSARLTRGKLRVEHSLAGDTTAEETTIDPEAVYPIFVERKAFETHPPAMGGTYSQKSLDLGTLGTANGEFQITGLDTALVGGKKVPVAHLRSRLNDNEIGSLQVEETVTWGGLPIASRFPAFHWQSRIVPRGDAMAWTVPPPVDTIAIDTDLPERWEQLERLSAVLTLRSSEAGLLLPEDGRQRLRRMSPRSVAVDLQRKRFTGKGAPRLPIGHRKDLDRFLKSSMYVQSDNSRIREMSRHIVAEERDSWQVARRLLVWVYNNMSGAETDVSFKSALEVLEDMRGSCSEYSVLFIALARAADLPARAVVGLLPTSPRSMGLHMWSQVYVGEWVDVDPSWNQISVDAGHVKVAESDLAMNDMTRLNLRLQLIQSQMDTVRVVSFDTPDGHHLAEADRLFADAQKAERDMKDQEAVQLFERLARMKANVRTGEAIERAGEIYQRLGQDGPAVLAFRSVLDHYPESSGADDAFFRLARIEETAGKYSEAVGLLTNLAGKYPDGDLADDALAMAADIFDRNLGDRHMASQIYRRISEEYANTGWGAVARNWLIDHETN